MGKGFRRRRGVVSATFTSFEGDLLRALAGQLAELLSDGQDLGSADRDPLERLFDFTQPAKEPDDPVVARLLPTAYPDDEESSADFRRYTESGLRSGKVDGARQIISSLTEAGLGDVPAGPGAPDIECELTLRQALSWMKTLTDLRLALAVRLGIDDDDDEEHWGRLGEEDPQAGARDIYNWLGYLQETLIGAVTR